MLGSGASGRPHGTPAPLTTEDAMDPQQFDRLTQQFSRALTRRRFGAVLAALGLGAGIAAQSSAKPKKGKKKKKKPKPCASGTLRCGSACVDAQSNAQHCGGCNQPCPSGQSCSAGQCRGGDCQGAQVRCGGQCVNPNTDEQHCGACGNACTGELTCLTGQCGCAEDTRCGNDCVDLDESNAHCGECGRACQGDLICQNGECGCATGTQCGNQCVNTQTDPNHCGACDDPCPAGESCVSGQCATGISCTNDFQCWNTIAETGGTPTCVNGFCRCGNSQAGICVLANGSRRCDVCCPGGSRNCPGDQVCTSTQTGVGVITSCNCPPGSLQCAGSQNSFLCQTSRNRDSRRCGIDCLDCDQVIPTGGAVCCNGTCTVGNPPGNVPGPGYPCPGNDCQPCEFGTYCCNSGPGTTGGCVAELDNLGRCPFPPP